MAKTHDRGLPSLKRIFLPALIALLSYGRPSAAADDPGISFNPVAEENRTRPSNPAEGIVLPAAGDVLDIDLVIWRGRQYALVGGDRNVRLYDAPEGAARLSEEPLAHAANRGRTLHVGFLPDLSKDDRIWFYVSSQRDDVSPATGPAGDLGFVTSFYTWDGRKILRVKQILSVIYRRLGPTLISQRIAPKKVIWGAVQTEIATVDNRGRLLLNRLGPLRLPAGTALYDFGRGDLNGDGTSEFIGAADIGISIAPSPAEIKTFYWMAPYTRIMAPVIADMDNDGRNDVVVVREEIVKEKGFLRVSSKKRFYTLAVFNSLNGILAKQFESDRLVGAILVFRHSADNRLFAAAKEDDGSIRIHWVSLDRREKDHSR